MFARDAKPRPVCPPSHTTRPMGARTYVCSSCRAFPAWLAPNVSLPAPDLRFQSHGFCT